jgi:hypothetical protein
MERSDDIDAATEDMAGDLEEMEARTERLEEEVEQTRSDWRRKQEDPSVPGAEPADSEEAGGEAAGDWEGEGPAADQAGQ